MKMDIQLFLVEHKIRPKSLEKKIGCPLISLTINIQADDLKQLKFH
jgi:hypothetical protein